MKFFLIVVLFFSNSCALIFSGKHQNINIMTSDPSASVEAEIVDKGSAKKVILPTSVTVARSSNNVMINIKENSCYKSSQAVVTSRFNWVALLDVFWGLFGLTSTTTDSSTGAIWKYDDNVVVNTTKKEGCKK
jgi:hypothetical protein